MAKNNLTPQNLNAVRLALLAGVVLFGFVAWMVRPEAPENPDVVNTLGMVAVGLVLAAAAGLLVLRRRMAALSGFDAKSIHALVGYALCEGATLMGGVVLLLGGPPTPYLAGLITFVASLSLLTVK